VKTQLANSRHQKIVGKIAGGSGAERNFLVQRRFQHEDKAFPMNYLPQSKCRKNALMQSIPLWEQRAGGPLDCSRGIFLLDLGMHDSWGRAAGVFRFALDCRRRGNDH
jgi:hypothetical protein